MIYLFYLFNLLYKPLYPFYRQIYFTYKSISEKQHVNKLKQNVKPGMVALDIGANIGFYSLILAQLVGKTGKVYAFEPDPTNFKHLKDNISSYKNIEALPKAVGQKKDKIRLYYSSNLNVDHQTYDNGENRKYKNVSMVSIDNLIKDKIDIIKIDVQGFDYFALLGMQKTIKRSGKVLLLGEFWPYGLIKAGIKPEQYLQLIKKLGFKLTFFGNQYKGEQKIDKHIYYDFYATKIESTTNLRHVISSSSRSPSA